MTINNRAAQQRHRLCRVRDVDSQVGWTVPRQGTGQATPKAPTTARHGGSLADNPGKGVFSYQRSLRNCCYEITLSGTEATEPISYSTGSFSKGCSQVSRGQLGSQGMLGLEHAAFKTANCKARGWAPQANEPEASKLREGRYILFPGTEASCDCLSPTPPCSYLGQNRTKVKPDMLHRGCVLSFTWVRPSYSQD